MGVDRVTGPRREINIRCEFGLKIILKGWPAALLKRDSIANRDYCSHFSVIFEVTSKCLIVFVRLMLGKVKVDGFTGPRRKIDMRYEFGLKVILKGLGCKYRFLQSFLTEFPSNN